ncbi:hypothetical protein AMJ52_08220 [candidate division TA06 bacterium DG_78]|uniref:Glycosyltransferase RgtA/B/C/D-like domain-containing protein n=1 Tax=candidate division TA06 bacterium DG_78 TaxID=1703772 RepID=A0A0S7YB63_UNCT6|nr:MAG: hypothetical protein AMJ52_08220 [candidate division TA06 bacterium DG_78]
MLKRIANKVETINPLLVTFAVSALQCLVFFSVACLRLIDGDEGYYVLASKLVMAGKVLYNDFVYSQMPLLPYVYGCWMKIFGVSWLSARLASALFAVLLGSMLYQHAVHLFGKRIMGLLAVFLYTFCGLAFGWYTIARTNSLATLLIFGSYLMLCHRTEPSHTYRYLLSGLLLGLAIDTRLFFFSATPAFIIGIFLFEKETKRRFASLGLFFIGLGIAFLPNLFFILTNPENYFFNNIWYHSIRTPYGLIGAFKQKIYTVFKLLSGNSGFQYLTLLLLNINYFISNMKKQLPISFFIAMLLFITCLLPTPTYVEYFSITLPFIIINSLYSIDDLRMQLTFKNEKSLRKKLGRLLVIILIAYFFISLVDFYRYISWGKDVPGVYNHEDAINWKIHTVNQIASEIDKHAHQNESVISWWPGYFIESRASVFPKMETHFAAWISEKLNKSQLERYHIISPEEIDNHLRKHSTRLVVLGNMADKSLYRDVLLESGYVLITKIGEAEIYKWRD